MEQKTMGRNFYVTECGYVGWISPFAQIGDEIYIFRDCNIVFVARKVGDGGNLRYIIRGDCYIHGVAGREPFETSLVQAVGMKII